MPLYAGRESQFTELVQTGINGNDGDAATEALDVSENTYITFDVVKTGGTCASAVFTPQCSLNGTKWYSMVDDKLTGEGRIDNIQSTPRYFRVKVTTAEGGSCTVTICIQGK